MRPGHNEPPYEHDEELARLLSSSRAPSFGPYFTERVMDRVRTEANHGRSFATGPMTPAVPRRSFPSGFGRGAVASLLSPRLAWALSIVALAVAATGWLQLRTRVITAGASPVVAALPDGTSVTVAAGSQIGYRSFLLRSTRNVTLSGEAFFDVEHDARPFIVTTFDATVTVTGTKFNLRAWPDAERPSTEIALVEGSVLFAPAPPVMTPSAKAEQVTGSATAELSTIALSAGESAYIAATGARLRAEGPDPETRSSWRNGGIVFSDQPLADVLRELERRFSVRIDADSSVTSGRTATYINPGHPRLEDVLDAVAFALNLNTTRTAQGWKLVAGTIDR